MPPIIKINSLTKKYGTFTAVDNISINVNESSLFAFLGPNGAGKSTSINILCTLLDKNDGEVLINGYELSRQDDNIRKLIGVVFQDSVLDDLLTVKENIEIRASFYGIKGVQFKKHLYEIGDVLNIGDILNKKYSILSGGQKRRADIARALINTPKILFLDEPTTGLDPQTRLHVWDSIKALKSEKKMTVFFSTHYMDEAAIADDVAIIDHGKIVARGTPSELRVNYSNDHLKIAPKDINKLISYLNQNNLKFIQGIDFLDISIKNSMHALDILKEIENEIHNFEVIRGSMDDVFINITGKKIREEGE